MAHRWLNFRIHCNLGQRWTVCSWGSTGNLFSAAESQFLHIDSLFHHAPADQQDAPETKKFRIKGCFGWYSWLFVSKGCFIISYHLYPALRRRKFVETSRFKHLSRTTANTDTKSLSHPRVGFGIDSGRKRFAGSSEDTSLHPKDCDTARNFQ